MKHNRRLIGALLSGLILVGCSQGGGVSKAVSETCMADIQGMTMTVILNAPSEDADLSSIDFDFKIPFDVLRANAGDAAASLSDEQLKEAAIQSESIYKSMISSMIGVEEDAIKVETSDTEMNLNLNMTNFDKFREIAGMNESDSMIYKDVVKSLQDDSDFTCD